MSSLAYVEHIFAWFFFFSLSWASEGTNFIVDSYFKCGPPLMICSFQFFFFGIPVCVFYISCMYIFLPLIPSIYFPLLYQKNKKKKKENMLHGISNIFYCCVPNSNLATISSRNSWSDTSFLESQLLIWFSRFMGESALFMHFLSYLILNLATTWKFHQGACTQLRSATW